MSTYKYLGLAYATLLMITSQPVVAASAADVAPDAAPDIKNADANVDFAADRLDYDQDHDIVTASGDVRMSRAGYRLSASSVIWNRKTGEVTAQGVVAITSPSGDVAYGDNIKLTDTLKDGAVENMLVVMADGGRLAAAHGDRKGDNNELGRATYSPCAVLDSKGCPKHPFWLITAKRIDFNSTQKKVRYHGARFEVLGVPILFLPYFWHSTSNQPATGLLTTQIEESSNNGFEIKQPFYIHLSNQRDLTLTPYIFTGAKPALQAEFRQLTKTGAFDISVFGTDGFVTPTAIPNGVGKELFRGYLDVSGRFQLSPQWDVYGSLRLATDRTLLASYDLSFDDRLRNNITLERIGPTSYLSVDAWGVETLRPLESQGLTPIALPEIDYRKRFDEKLLGGKIDLQFNSLAISRTSGQDTQRAFTSAEWNLRKLTPLGQEIIFTAFARGDIYHSDANNLTSVALYQGQPGWESRAIGALAAEVRWPLVGSLFGGTQRLTPRLQIVASPPTTNLSIPNEDARAIELDDTNLFALNRFPGYDRWEDGTRITYGIDWALDRPGLSITTNIGQSYRFSSAPSLFPDGTGLTSRFSDIVGRTTIKYHNFFTLTHRYRLDKENFAIRRNEVDATIGSPKTYLTISYLKLNRHINPTLEDLQDHEEVRAGGRMQFAKFWSVYGSTILDLTTKALDPQSLTDGLSPVRHRLGIAYENDCIKLDFSWRRDFGTSPGTPAGTTFKLLVSFRNLGR